MTNEQVRSAFVSKDEQLVAIMGHSIAQSFFASGRIEKGFAILSNRRLYFKGSCLIRKGAHFSKIREERTVDVTNITGSGFVYFNPVWLRVCACIFWALSALDLLGALIFLVQILFFHANFDVTATILGGGLLCGIGAIFNLIYKAKKRTIFEVAFAGGGIGLDVRWATAQEADFFQKNLKLVSDRLKSEEKLYGHATSAAAELEKYASLLEKGLISQAEYDEQKRKLLL